MVTSADVSASAASITIPSGNCLWDGLYTVVASFRDAAGKQSPKATASFEVDRTAPLKPSQPTAYEDDVGESQSQNSVATVTDDARPRILVGKNLEDTPRLYVDGKRVAATYDSGKGTLTPNQAVADGLRSFSFTLTDDATGSSFAHCLWDQPLHSSLIYSRSR